MVDTRPDRPNSGQTRDSDDLQLDSETTRTQDQTPFPEEHGEHRQQRSAADQRHGIMLEGNEDGDTMAEGDEALGKEQRQNRLAELVARLGLDAPTLMIMFKGSLPPIIGIAMYQAPAVSSYFQTLGYLIPVISVLALAILPRGKFMMNFLLNLLAITFGSALSMLALWSAIQARHHTTPSGPQPPLGPTYNSSQSAVCAIWLFANIWFGNVVRAKLPAFNLPVIIYSILVNVSATYGPFLTTTAAARAFIEQLFTAMLVSLALAFAVNILVFPVSSRLVVFKEFAGGIGLLRQIVSLQKAYLISLESDDMFATVTRTETLLDRIGGHASHQEAGETPKLTKEAKAARGLQEAGAKMRELMGKLHADMRFAKRDIAWGKLDAKDLSELFNLFRNVFIPVLGMMTIIDIFKRVSERRGWDTADDAPEEVVAEKEKEKHVWNEVMKQMHEPFEILSQAIDQGLEHAGICLELLPRPKKVSPKAGKDLEAGERPKPGDRGFARIVDGKVDAFHSKKGELLKTWIREKGFDLNENNAKPSRLPSERDQAQLNIILYMENLMHASGEAVQGLIAFADVKVDEGTMSRKRLITPTFLRLRKWFLAVFSSEDSSAEQAPDLMETSANIVFFGDGYNKKKDPEHLPPATAWQHFGNALRNVPKFFGSEESVFGFRVACATMTIGIVAFLERTQQFFMAQRLVWAMIIIALGMTMTSGQSFFGFLCRVGGTVVAMCFSLVIWYIVDERTPGAIVFLWLFVFIEYYFFIKYPRFVPAVMVAIVTQAMIIGYELQVLAIGREVAERTGQPYYPCDIPAGPYRLACVAGGSLVAFFWTIFPSPQTDRTWLRRDLSATLYLLANYFGVISSTLQSNVRGTAGDADMPGTPAHQLLKISRKIFGKVMMLIPSMSQHSEWQRWEPTIGGKYPREAYDNIILRGTRIMAYLTLVSYTLRHPPRLRSTDGDGNDSDTEDARRPRSRGNLVPLVSRRSSSVPSATRLWAAALSEVLAALRPTHHAIVSTLALLSNSLLSGQRLPPFVPLPRPHEVAGRLARLGRQSTSAASASASSPSSSSTDPEADGSGGGGGPIRMVDSRTGRDDSYPATAGARTRAGARNPGRSRDAAAASILDPRNMEQPGYAEFAVLQVCTTLVCDDLEELVKAVSGLVGVVDFSFRFVGGDSTLSLGRGDENNNGDGGGGVGDGARKSRGKGKVG
ncbi:ER transporter 6TM N-terminal domain-containing protein [Madurella fahalii]|uniref:ER transporter 6TM N-terminal domain-containing protein n=1 Tax=Madurella fahalii TaxID=1157608 RepID=A0ABQ0GT32_9PEZI